MRRLAETNDTANTMKIFDRTETWPTKVNFVDENNVVLGYDAGQICCEHAGWFIADQPCRWMPEPYEWEPEHAETQQDLPGWCFDPVWFKCPREINECGGMVIFRIVNGDAERFIHLFNCHNGYYKHDFELKTGDAVLNAGQL